MAEVTRVSASQVELFQACKRAWYNRHVLKLTPPSTPAQLCGTAIHAEIEHYLTTGEIRESEYKAFVEVAKEHLPPPGMALVEHQLGADQDTPKSERGVFTRGVATYPGGPAWVGLIDVLGVTPPEVLDIKTTSDFKYAKTTDQLKTNTQLTSYAYFVHEQFDAPVVNRKLVYLRTKNKSKPKAHVVEVAVSREETQAGWDKLMPVVKDMVKTAAMAQTADDVTPNTAHCGDYGGCPYRVLCGLTPAQNQAKEKRTMGNLREKLKEMEAQRQPAPAVSILPPDAPPRTTSDEDMAALEPQKRGRKKTVSVTIEPTPALSAQATEQKNLPPSLADNTLGIDSSEELDIAKLQQSSIQQLIRALQKGRPILFVTCDAVKGLPGAVPLEEWLQPIAEKAALEANVADYRLVPYGEGKGLLAKHIREAIDTFPKIVTMTPGQASDEVFAIIAPHAALIVRKYG